MEDRLKDKHLQRLVRLLCIKLSQRWQKRAKTQKQQILMPTIKQLATYRAEVYGDDEKKTIRELKYLCGLI